MAGGEGGCGAGVEVIGGDDGALSTTLTLRAGPAGRGGVQDGRTPLFDACRYGHEEVVKLLLADARADVKQADNHDSTPLLSAAENAENGFTAIVASLASGAAVNVQDKVGAILRSLVDSTCRHVRCLLCMLSETSIKRGGGSECAQCTSMERH